MVDGMVIREQSLQRDCVALEDSLCVGQVQLPDLLLQGRIFGKLKLLCELRRSGQSQYTGKAQADPLHWLARGQGAAVARARRRSWERSR
jgi:hypothetical protein